MVMSALRDVRVSVIGSARDKDENVFKVSHWPLMMKSAREIIFQEWDLSPENVILVSGGAAWGDHIAVALHKEFPKTRLELHLPCVCLTQRPADFSTMARVPTGGSTRRTCPTGLTPTLPRLSKPQPSISSKKLSRARPQPRWSTMASTRATVSWPLLPNAWLP